jgi:hypothetical protein
MDTKRKRSWRRWLIIAGVLLLIGIWAIWPRLRTIPSRFGQLDKYLVYEAGRKVSPIPGVRTDEPWRAPRSRTELLSRPEHEVRYLTVTTTEVAQAQQPARRAHRLLPEVRFQAGDSLRDFVVEQADRYVHPESQEELEKALAADKAERASSFFQRPWRRKTAGSLPVRRVLGDRVRRLRRQ